MTAGPVVVQTPDICGGRPRIVGTRVETRDVAIRFHAGESIAELARDFDLPVELVEAALRFELNRPKAPRPR